MDPVILDRSLKLIEEIYNESMYGDKDIFRIKDIIHSVDSNHWNNKQWLADVFRNIYGDYEGGKFIVLGGWYGMMAYQLRKKFNNNFHIISSDMDPKCKDIGYKLFHDQNIEFTTLRMEDLNEDASAIICTSCEHIDNKILNKIIKNKNKSTWIAFQSADLEHPTHINTSKSLMEFVESLELRKIEYQGKWENDSFTRFMVIGR